jgi:hypothetical protein
MIAEANLPTSSEFPNSFHEKGFDDELVFP